MKNEIRIFLEEAKENIDPKDYETAEHYFNALDTYTTYDREESYGEFSEIVKADAIEFYNENNNSNDFIECLTHKWSKNNNSNEVQK